MKKMVASAAVIAAFGLAAPAMAQSQPETTGKQTGQEQTAQKDPGTEVKVDQGAPDVTVTQPAPTVTVVDPEPKVKVETPEPQVTVDQPKPEVEVEQGKPDVQVQQSDNADVIMKEKETTAQTQTGTQTEPQSQQQAGMSAQELEALVGKEIYDQEGNEAGEIAEVLPAQGSGSPQVVIERGGVLGIGEKQYVISADQLQMNGEQVQVPMSKQQISELPRYEGSQQEGQSQ
ncbi:PRC-barrel domain-containing protein [Caenispirillum bisanense]|uniref:PRC-barrel domain-containing protein n=1 Tax=Caenispirillum bisanense TaxID=414052 RepID=A0A286GSH3_9PROT|nr:PRC-barrel domain-containing protein [Caenispirillum bisanense]SOD98019.1 PRC-barrel domain-containing protein [Caenispirillum bisanense]